MILIRCTIALGAALLMSSAGALVGGRDPAVRPVIDPRTGQQTPVWRLSGYFAPMMTSGVQISPRWVLTAGHAVTATGFDFINSYGRARVDRCHKKYPSNNGVYQRHQDFAVCRLQTPIAVPSGFEFPVLVEDPVILAGDRQAKGLTHTVANHLGGFLSVSHGGPESGLPRYVWTDLLSTPLSERAHQLKYGASIPAAYHSGGDSGSVKFWFSPQNPKVAVVGVQVQAAPVGLIYTTRASAGAQASWASGTYRFSMEDLRWLQQLVSESGDQVQISTARDFHGAVTTAPSWLDTGALKASATSPTSVRLSWSVNPGQEPEVQRFLVSVMAGDEIVRVAVARFNARSIEFKGLPTGADYTACVEPAGLGGQAHSTITAYEGKKWILSRLHNCVPFTLQAGK